MPQKILNSGFEATKLSTGFPPFWNIKSGSPIIKTDHPWSGLNYLAFPAAANNSVSQSFSSPVKASQFSLWAAENSGSIFNYKLYYADGTTETQVSSPPVINPSNITFIGQAVSSGLIYNGGTTFNLNSISNVLPNDFIFVGFEVSGNNSLASISDSQSNTYTILSSNYNSVKNNTVVTAGSYASALTGQLTVNARWNGSSVNNFGASVANYRGANGIIPTNIQLYSSLSGGGQVNITVPAGKQAALIGVGDGTITGTNQNNRATTQDKVPTVVSFQFKSGLNNVFNGGDTRSQSVFVVSPQDQLIVYIHIFNFINGSLNFNNISVSDNGGNRYTQLTVNAIGDTAIAVYVATANSIFSGTLTVTINVPSTNPNSNWSAAVQLCHNVLPGNFYNVTTAGQSLPPDSFTISQAMSGPLQSFQILCGAYFVFTPNTDKNITVNGGANTNIGLSATDLNVGNSTN